MLKRVEIHNYRSCENVVLDDLGPMTVLVGRNAVGKTNILRAIQWAAESATSNIIRDNGTITLDVQIEELVYRYSLKVDIIVSGEDEREEIIESLEVHRENELKQIIFTRKGEDVELLFPEQNKLSVRALTPCLTAISSIFPADHPVIEIIRPFLSALENIRYYPLEMVDFDASNTSVLTEQYNSWLKRYIANDDPGNSVLLRLLYIWQTNKALFNEILDLLGANGLGVVNNVNIILFELLRDEKQHFYLLSFLTNEYDCYFNALSAGTQRIVRLIVSLIFDQSSVMLIEHPEDSIHRGLLRKVIDVLQGYSDQHQMILSSHSAVVFDTLDPMAVRLVTMENDATKVRKLTPDELRAAKLFMEEEGSLSDFIETVEEV